MIFTYEVRDGSRVSSAGVLCTADVCVAWDSFNMAAGCCDTGQSVLVPGFNSGFIRRGICGDHSET